MPGPGSYAPGAQGDAGREPRGPARQPERPQSVGDAAPRGYWPHGRHSLHTGKPHGQHGLQAGQAVTAGHLGKTGQQEE